MNSTRTNSDRGVDEDLILLDVHDICEIFGIVPNTVWRWVSKGRFPRADVRPTRNYYRWRMSTVRRFVNEKHAPKG